MKWNLARRETKIQRNVAKNTWDVKRKPFKSTNISNSHFNQGCYFVSEDRKSPPEEIEAVAERCFEWLCGKGYPESPKEKAPKAPESLKHFQQHPTVYITAEKQCICKEIAFMKAKLSFTGELTERILKNEPTDRNLMRRLKTNTSQENVKHSQEAD